VLIDSLTLQLFGQFPREVANPSRTVVHDLYGLKKFLIYNEGIRDCYISQYPLTGEITSILFELDGYARALEDAKKIYNYLTNLGEIVVPVASGKKGIHLHLLLRPKKYGTEEETKKILHSKTYSILISVFGETDYNKTTVDTSTIGDVRQIIRLPNTRRPPRNNSWCTYLPPGFVDSEWLDIINYTKMPHRMDRVPIPTTTLDDIPDPSIKIEGPQLNHLDTTIPISGNWFLEGVLRPCLYRGIMQPHPLHDMRVAATIDLLISCSPHEILQIYSGLGWTDFNTDATMTQIKSCAKYERYECPTLKRKGMCFVDVLEDCPLGAVPRMVASLEGTKGRRRGEET